MKYKQPSRSKNMNSFSILTRIIYLKEYFIAVIIFLNFSVGYGQVNSLVLPHSPNAYSFGKYGEIPVSLYSGVPDISIPVGSINDHGAQLDISLSYHASGIKVDEIASWVGLGWNLNAGGAITRVVRGKPEMPNGTGGISPVRYDLGFPEPPAGQNGCFSSLTTLQIAAENNVDIEPDEFYFNFNGHSGRFIFDANGNAQLFKYADLKIKFTRRDPNLAAAYNNTKFVITDEQGVVYEFEKCDYTSSSTLNLTFPSAWYLTKVKSPQGGVLTLTYEDQSAVHYINEKLSELIGENKHITGYYPYPSYSYGSSTEAFLQSITSSNSGKIIFSRIKDSAHARKDYRSLSYPLDEISIYDLNNVVVKNIKFYTNYFTSPAFLSTELPGISDKAPYDHLRFRLKLDSVKVFSGDRQKYFPPYKFDYYNSVNATLYNLPYRLSPQQDHWGYYNSSGNTTLIPQINGTIYAGYWLNKLLNMGPDEYTIHSASGFTGGANREPNSEAVKACSLHKIIYPTKGYTYFNLESNDYGANNLAGGLRIASIANYDSNNTKVKETFYIYKNFVPTSNPPYNSYSSGDLIDDPTRYYVLAGRARDNGQGTWVMPEAPIYGWFGSSSDWSGVGFSNTGYVYKISATPQATLGSTLGQSVGYSSVIVHESGNGYSVSMFDSPSEFPNCWDRDQYLYENNVPSDILQAQYSTTIPCLSCEYLMVRHYTPCNEFPFLPQYDNDWQRGNLISFSQYNESKQILYNQTNEYFKVNQTNVPGYKVYSLKTNGGIEYLHGKYYIPANWTALKKQTEYQYDAAGTNPVAKITEFEYNGTYHKFLTKKILHANNGDIVSSYYYPRDLYITNLNTSQTVRDTMKARNIVSTVLKQEEFLNGTTFLSGTVSDFMLSSNVIVPSDVEIAKSDGAYETRIFFNTYDGLGNLRQFTDKDGIISAYLWDTSGTYLMAVVKGATYSTVSGNSTLMNYINQLQNYKELTNSTDRNALKTLNNNIRNNGPANSMITTYTYDPLVGMTSQADANGVTTFYEYDTLGRLIFIRNDDTDITNRYTYHYKQ